MQMQVKIGLSGFGHVGRNFAALLAEKEGDLSRRYSLDLQLVLAANSRGAVSAENGLDPGLLGRLQASRDLDGLKGFTAGLTGPAAVAAAGAAVWVEATPSPAREGFEPAFTNMKLAIAGGIHVVTLSKGPLVHAFAEIMELAAAAGVKIKYSGATAAALPTVDVALASLAGSRITAVEGILNGTSNYILTCMEEEGLDFAGALARARQQGIAEPDPSLDVGGWDTAYKLLIIANTLFGGAFTLEHMDVQGIEGIGPADQEAARRLGGTLKLVGSARLTGEGYILQAGPQILPGRHPLAGVRGTSKGIHFVSDTLGPLTVLGGPSDPRGAAAAALKDIINLYQRG
jgi:homoserine dehydrogenase